MRRQIGSGKCSLTSGDKILIGISACMASAKWSVMRKLLGEAGDTKLPASVVYEVILQAYLFLGYPRALEGLRIFREIYGEDSGELLKDYSFENWREWKNRGNNLCRKVYGRNFDRLMIRVGELSPELSEWMIVEGYGKVLSRGVLTGAMRELCTVAALVVTADINQLHSHMRGAGNMGADKAMIKEAVFIAGYYCTKANLNRGLKLYEKIFEG